MALTRVRQDISNLPSHCWLALLGLKEIMTPSDLPNGANGRSGWRHGVLQQSSGQLQAAQN
jgi:hypothetical protein